MGRVLRVLQFLQREVGRGDQRLAASVTAVNHAVNLFQPVFCPSLHTEIIKYQQGVAAKAGNILIPALKAGGKVIEYCCKVWVLGCYTQFGELSRMTQFKMKSQQHADNITAGLFTYPVLMAADILVYQADLVPVGEDQKQHVELCRDIATRFNNSFPDTFTLPEPFIPKMGARIMSLGSPENKMSKSDPDGCVYMMDKPEDIMRKFKRAVTDCETAVRYDRENKPGVSNLLTIYCAATGKTMAEAEAEFAGQGYGVFKPAVGEAVVELMRPIREETEKLLGDKAYLESIYKEGAEKASYLANKTLRKVYKKVGFVAR